MNGRKFGWMHGRVEEATQRLLAGAHATVHPSKKSPPKAAYYPRHRWLDQGSTGTCYAHAAVAMVEAAERKAGIAVPMEVSRRFVAWEATQLRKPGASPDDGGTVTDAVLSLTEASKGVTREQFCPFTQDRLTLATTPDPSAFEMAAHHKLNHLPLSLASWSDTFTALASGNAPVAIALAWPDSWSRSDQMKTDVAGWFPMANGHAVLLAGYITIGHVTWCVIRNSWGPSIYQAPPADVLALLKPYGMTLADPEAGKTDEFLVRIDALAHAAAGAIERVSVVNLDGLNPELARLMNMPEVMHLEGVYV